MLTGGPGCRPRRRFGRSLPAKRSAFRGQNCDVSNDKYFRGPAATPKACASSHVCRIFRSNRRGLRRLPGLPLCWTCRLARPRHDSRTARSGIPNLGDNGEMEDMASLQHGATGRFGIGAKMAALVCAAVTCTGAAGVTWSYRYLSRELIGEEFRRQRVPWNRCPCN